MQQTYFTTEVDAPIHIRIRVGSGERETEMETEVVAECGANGAEGVIPPESEGDVDEGELILPRVLRVVVRDCVGKYVIMLPLLTTIFTLSEGRSDEHYPLSPCYRRW